MDAVARHYNLASYPSYSIPLLKKAQQTVHQLLVEEFKVSGLFVLGNTLRSVSRFLIEKWISKPDDYVNPTSGWEEDHITFQEELQELYDKRLSIISNILSLYSDSMYTPEVVRKVSWHLAGWKEEIIQGLPIPVWKGDVPIWAPLYISSCDRVISTTGKRVYELKCKSLGGPTVAREWPTVCTSARLQAIMREIGLPKFEEHKDADIGGMYFTCLLQAKEKGLDMSDIHVSSSQKSINKKLYKVRLNGCTGAFQPYTNKECVPCPVGRDRCPISRISEGYYYTRACETGHIGYFKDLSSHYCFLCLITGRAKKDRYG